MVVRVVVDANAGHVELVQLAVLHADDHLGMGRLCAGGCTIFAVHGDIEPATHAGLELEGLRDALLGPGEVLAGRDDRERVFAFEQGFVWVTWHGYIRY